MLRALADPELAEAAAEPQERTDARERSIIPQSFTAELIARLGRNLTAAEQCAAREVDRVFRDYREAEAVPLASLEIISAGGTRKISAWESVSLWPEPPVSAWDAWLYIAAYLRRAKKDCPSGLLAATDWEEVNARVGDWERAVRIERWQEWLEKTVESGSGTEREAQQLRVRLTLQGAQLEFRKGGTGEFKAMSDGAYQRFASESFAGRAPFTGVSQQIWQAFHTGYGSTQFHAFTEPDCARILNTLLRREETAGLVVGPQGEPFKRPAEPLAWRIEQSGDARIDYALALVQSDGTPPPPALAMIDGTPSLYITSDTIFSAPPLGGLTPAAAPIVIPAEALETGPGAALLERLRVPPPPRLAGRMRAVALQPVFHCAIIKDQWGEGEHLVVQAFAETARGEREELYTRDGWMPVGGLSLSRRPDEIVRLDRRALAPVPGLIEALRLQWWPHENHWHKTLTKKFPDQFAAWLAALPENVAVELDPLLATFRDGPIRAAVRLEVAESEIDWFDIRVALDVADTSLTPAEVKLLLAARGGYVRLGAKGWRRLAFELSAEDESQLADLGLSARDLSSKPQRLHALQLAGKSAARRMLGEGHAAIIERRAADVKTRVAPPLPEGLRADLRPYQVEGYHFLAYLTENKFGGILADDMGLGKTVQTLAWLLWLRSRSQPATSPDPAGVPEVKGLPRVAEVPPALVVCPKSVTDNWLGEATRFAPELRVRILPRGATVKTLATARAGCDLLVINYAQLRILETALVATPWQAVILDEAQAIKNAESQTARAAWTLSSPHRLALSGTPIENRLLDLWSIMNFVMPGVLGARAAFGRTYDQRSDPLARRRLTARVRPFVLRRTKNEVAKELPERVEEDLLCEMEGEQSTLYRAELKRARAALLKIATPRELDTARFHILSSLLRLRQICCDPALVAPKPDRAESAKLSALLDLLEPLIEEGHKVLVFSQFVEMLSLVRGELQSRDWPFFLLTGETENRGALIDEFQRSAGAAIFLISLRAGGFGLNLTAASYVVLYDPWWNPAVENQAIDRTHRIGQTNKVIAYRLLVKNSIEEKIRTLQKQKRALAEDILGEETFARALSLDDFQFLLGE